MRRLLATCAAALLLGVVAAPADAAPEPRTQRLAVLDSDHAVYTAPSRTAKRITTLFAHRPITGQQTAVPVIAQRKDGGETWLRVRLPGRPNGRSGWLSERETTRADTPWRLVVELRTRRVLVYRDGRRVRTYRSIIGTASTPTPQGRFFVEEIVRMDSREPGAPWELATSARSNALERYEGGVGQIALHGTGNLAGTLGTPGSHGCVRLAPADVTWLAAKLRPGVPITVTAR